MFKGFTDHFKKFVAVRRGIVDSSETNGYFVACILFSNTIRYSSSVTILAPSSIVGNYTYDRRLDNG